MESREKLRGEPLGGLFTKLVDRARDAARAEVAYYRGIATAKAGEAAIPIGLLVAALFVAQASLTTLIIAIGAGIAMWIGVPAGLAVGALLGFAVTGLLAWIATAKFKAIGGK